jgi:hypothetical protein
MGFRSERRERLVDVPAVATPSLKGAMLYKHAICSCARMEQDSIVEWVEYHRSIGFEHFFIYGNDDDFRILAEVLAPLISSRVVTFTQCPELGEQVKMYLHFLRWHARSCEWICFLDQDEFIRLTGFDDSIDELTNRAARNYDSIEMNWLNYGNSGFLDRPQGSVLRQYTRRDDAVHVNTKHVSRSRAFFAEPALRGPFWHTLAGAAIRKCSALLEPMSYSESLANTGPKDRYVEYVTRESPKLIDSACIAHYHLKSEADFRRRVERGTAGQFHGQVMYRQIAENPLERRKFIEQSNRVEDLYLARYWEAYVDSLMLGNPAW